MEQSSTFYTDLQNSQSLDLRDNRGKRHNICLILLGVMIALLRNRDGCLSSIHRSMINCHEPLLSEFWIDYQRVVSRSHLPIVLQKVCSIEFNRLLFKHYGIELTKEERKWFSCDGKELRGSILDGNTRGECVVQAVDHEDRDVKWQSYYNGKKESEKPCVQELLIKSGLCEHKISLDALHLCPKTTDLIETSGGIFLIGLKLNQKELFEDMEIFSKKAKNKKEFVCSEKGHGRVDKRTYSSFDITEEYLDKRWIKSNLCTLVKVERQRYILKNQKESTEISYYVSNQSIKGKEEATSKELFSAVRNHWTVEVNNHLRDVTLKEDQLRSKKKGISILFSEIRTLIIKLLQKEKPVNMKARLEEFSDDIHSLMSWLKKINFL